MYISSLTDDRGTADFNPLLSGLFLVAVSKASPCKFSQPINSGSTHQLDKMAVVVGIDTRHMEAPRRPRQTTSCMRRPQLKVFQLVVLIPQTFLHLSPPGGIGDVWQGGPILQDRHRLAGILNAPSQGATIISSMLPCCQAAMLSRL